ncbi:MAG: DUF2378 family protein [Clostridia bacterium]|nr:DUF2378 family protein [Clostridia bacterium]
MNKVKAVNSVTLKKWLEEKEPHFAEELAASLSPETRQIYQSLLAVQWLTTDAEKEILQNGARLLFPGDPEAMERLGHFLAHQTMTGIYRLFLTIPSIHFVLRRVASMWSTFYQSGVASLKEVSPRRICLVVKDFAEMEPYQQKMTTGYIQAITELTGIKKAQVSFNGQDPQAWEWQITWEE